MYWSFLEDLLPNETGILCWKYTFYFGYKHKIHELVIFNQTTKIDAHEEKYFHSIVSTPFEWDQCLIHSNFSVWYVLTLTFVPAVIKNEFNFV
jgi:hypothetical protein